MHHAFAACWLALALSSAVYAEPVQTHGPKYKPSAGSPAPISILNNRYGASSTAPHAIELGESAPDFRVPRAGGGTVDLGQLRAVGPVVIIFYRGHW